MMVNSDFKSSADTPAKEGGEAYPMALDFSDFLTAEGQRRGPSSLKTLIKYSYDKENIYLASGLPRVDKFPIEEISFKVRDPVTGELREHTVSQQPDAANTVGLNQAQQYGMGSGLPQLSKFLYDFTTRLHRPKYADYSIVPSAGNTDALYKMMAMFLNPGQPVVMARWGFPAALETLLANGVPLIDVAIDDEGLVPEDLDKKITQWNLQHPETRCKFMYTVPCGQNPTGATMSLARRVAIYEQARKHDLIIFEDDPYYFHQMPDLGDAEPLGAEELMEDQLIANYGYHNLVPSLFSLDGDGRVLRFDSFAKVLAPGIRLGWVSGSSHLIRKLQYFNEVSIQSPSGYSQLIASALLVDHWSPHQFELHIAKLRHEFTLRRNSVTSLLQRKGRHLVSWVQPKAGMFLWIQPKLPQAALTLENHTQPSAKYVNDLFLGLVNERIVVVPGSLFDTIRLREKYQGKYTVADDEQQQQQEEEDVVGANWFRICFTYADQDQVLLGLNRLLAKLESLHTITATN